MLSHLTNLVATAAGRVLQQYQPKPKLMALLGQISQQAQTLEDALWGMVAMFQVDTAQGVWLDSLGKIVNQQRGGLADADYRGLIKGRIIANRSNGTIPDLLTAIAACYSLDVGNGFELKEWDFCAATIRIPASVAQPLEFDPILQSTLKVMHGAKSAGVKLTLLYQPTDTPNMLIFDDSTAPTSPGLPLGDSTAPLTPAGQIAGASDA